MPRTLHTYTLYLSSRRLLVKSVSQIAFCWPLPFVFGVSYKLCQDEMYGDKCSHNLLTKRFVNINFFSLFYHTTKIELGLLPPAGPCKQESQVFHWDHFSNNALGLACHFHSNDYDVINNYCYINVKIHT